MTENKKTIMFGADWCSDCRRAKKVFETLGVDYTYVDLVEDESAIQVAQEIAGRKNIPVIVYPDQTFQVEPSNADIKAKVAELALGRA